MEAEEYIKKEWCNPIWSEWDYGDVIDALEEFGNKVKKELLQELIEEIEKEIKGTPIYHVGSIKGLDKAKELLMSKLTQNGQ